MAATEWINRLITLKNRLMHHAVFTDKEIRDQSPSQFPELRQRKERRRINVDYIYIYIYFPKYIYMGRNPSTWFGSPRYFSFRFLTAVYLLRSFRSNVKGSLVSSSSLKLIFWCSPLKFTFGGYIEMLGVFLWGNQIESDQYLLSLKRVVEKAANNKLLSCSPLFNLRFTESSSRNEFSDGSV